MRLSPVGAWSSWPRALAPALAAAAIGTFGCGPSTGGNSPPPPGKEGALAKKLNPDDFYKYEGEGAAKQKVPISRRERLKLLHEAAQKSE